MLRGPLLCTDRQTGGGIENQGRIDIYRSEFGPGCYVIIGNIM